MRDFVDRQEHPAASDSTPVAAAGGDPGGDQSATLSGRVTRMWAVRRPDGERVGGSPWPEDATAAMVREYEQRHGPTGLHPYEVVGLAEAAGYRVVEVEDPTP